MEPGASRGSGLSAEDMQIAERLADPQHPMAAPSRFPDYVPEPDRLQHRNVILLAPRIGDRQVDIDGRLGRESRD
jgi:hypothetical protein